EREWLEKLFNAQREYCQKVMGEEKLKVEKAVHYLKVLQKNHCFMQPDVREAIDYAIKKLSKLSILKRK
ncbi:unnamed protein product, partial [marine sediment metagenome]